MYSARSDQLKLAGFPHSEISGSRVVCTSPKLIAAYHVLHRLHAPRHPPCALSSLTIKFAHRKLDQHIVLLRLVPLKYPNHLWVTCGIQKNSLSFFWEFCLFDYQRALIALALQMEGKVKNCCARHVGNGRLSQTRGSTP